MDSHSSRGAGMDLSRAMAALPSSGTAVEAYRKAVSTAATMTAYAVLARGMARELLPDELRDTARWVLSFLSRRRPRHVPLRRTVIIKRRDEEGLDNGFYADARAYLGARIDPHALSRFCLSRRHGPTGGGRWDEYGNLLDDDDEEEAAGGGGQQVLSMVSGDSMTDVFEGVEFTWTNAEPDGDQVRGDASLDLSFDAEHTEMALRRYIPFVAATVAEARRRERALKIFRCQGASWRSGVTHQHPATFDTLAMDPELKRSIIADLDRFLKRKEYYRRIGKAWKRGYLLHGPPGTGKSSMVAAMANYLRFNIYDLDISALRFNSDLQWLLTSMSNKSILVIEDIDCCFSSRSQSDEPEDTSGADKKSSESEGVTLAGLLNFIDGLWSISGEERIIIFTTNFKDRLDPALLRPGRMDMHIHMGYCCREAFKTLAKNYFLIDDHALFPEIQELLPEAEATPAQVSEMLLRNDDAGVALQGLIEFLRDKKLEKGK